MNSNAFQFKPASKAQAKLRAALFGPSGSGKTFSALRIATGLGGRVAVIDTERGSASKYADRFGFDVLNLADKNIPMYQAAIQAAAQASYDVLIIDSLSHGWQELLAEVDRLASTKDKGNSWGAWSEGTPKQRALVDAILAFPGHLIATMRSKTEWAAEPGRNGKTRPVRIGLAPEQGKGIEYEFDLLLEISQDHVAQVIKDRSGRFQDQMLDKPGEQFGAELATWLNDAPPAEPKLSLVGSQAAPTDSNTPEAMAMPSSASPPSGNAPHDRSSDDRPRSERGAPNNMPPTDQGGAPQLISEPQHRRLEARLNELRLDRERVKNWIAAKWGVQHFPDLNQPQYAELDDSLERFAVAVATENHQP